MDQANFNQNNINMEEVKVVFYSDLEQPGMCEVKVVDEAGLAQFDDIEISDNEVEEVKVVDEAGLVQFDDVDISDNEMKEVKAVYERMSDKYEQEVRGLAQFDNVEKVEGESNDQGIRKTEEYIEEIHRIEQNIQKLHNDLQDRQLECCNNKLDRLLKEHKTERCNNLMFRFYMIIMLTILLVRLNK